MRARRIMVATLGLIALTVSVSRATLLQSVYDSAGGGEGYDKLLILDPSQSYTGGLWIRLGVKCCIHGNGAVIDLQYSGIRVQDNGTVLDIDHCVLTHGQYGLIYVNNATGTVRNNTILQNNYGIDSQGGKTSLLIENNIIADNANIGIYCEEYHEPIIQYNTVSGNPKGDYVYRCG